MLIWTIKFIVNIAQREDIRQNEEHWKQTLRLQKHNYHPIEYYVNNVDRELKQILY